jgi:hypothetical protein
MKNQGIQKKPDPTPADTRVIAADGLPPEHPPGAAPGSSSLLRWLVLVGVVGAAVGVAVVVTHSREEAPSQGGVPRGARGWKPEEGEKLTETEEVVDRFMRLHKGKDKAALDLLGPAPVFDENPVSEKEADARATDHFLRGKLRILDWWRGEPDGKGGQRPKANHFTLVTKGNVSSPPMRIRTDKGVEGPSQTHLTNPDLIVLVRDGKIHGVRADLHVGP